MVTARPISSATSIAAGSASFSAAPMITGWGWMVRHHMMDRYTMGTSRKATMPITAENRARRVGSGV